MNAWWIIGLTCHLPPSRSFSSVLFLSLFFFFFESQFIVGTLLVQLIREGVFRV